MNELFLASISAQAERQLQDGKTFVLDAPTTIPALWGSDSDVLWSEGESLVIVGPPGVGKSTLVQQLALARAGITEPNLLGFPVKADDQGCVLYIAADRPRQIARSFRRMVGEQHADALEQRLKVWRGPPPIDVVHEPHRLAVFVESLGAHTVIIDSLKDIASPLSSDEVGSAVNRALAILVAAEIDVVALHHNRKATAENKKPRTLADVYGSVWLTSGAGSVISLFGEAGDPFVELTHLKQPADDVGPLDLEHDHDLGVTRLRERADAWSLLQAAGRDGVTAPDVAVTVYGSKPTRPQIEKVRRKLKRFADRGFAVPIKGATSTDPIVFRAVPLNGSVEPRGGVRGGPRGVPRDLHDSPRTPGNTDHGHSTPPSSSGTHLSVSPERGVEIDGWSDEELQDLVDSQAQLDAGGQR